MKRTRSLLVFSVIAAHLIGGASAEEKKAAPLKALLITGGCCHDYTNQKDIVSEGISARVPTEWTIFLDGDEKKNKEYLSNPNWADGYDFVVYNHCFAKQADEAFIKSVTSVHEAGVPAMALHCAMHSFHWNVKASEKDWPKFLGVSSKGHGPKAPITVKKVKGQENHPVVMDLPDGWKTPEGELYNVQKVLDSATVLAYGENGVAKEPQACIWVNTYGKSKVMATTIGHHNSTMSEEVYLDMLANGVLWLTGDKE